MGLLGIYRPRRTPLHAASPWLKLAALSVFSAAVVVLHGAALSIAFFAVAVSILASTLPPAKETLKVAIPIVVVSVLAGLFQWWRGDPGRAVEVGADLSTLVLVSLALTTSTSLDQLISVFERVLGVFSRVLPTRGISLALSLMLRSIPAIIGITQESRDAARARGMSRSPRAVLIPTAVRTVAYALRVGEALEARGIADEAQTLDRNAR